MHQPGLRALKGLFNCSMSLVFTFLCATNQAKALTLEGTFVFHKKLAGEKGIESEKLDKAKKKTKLLKRMEPKLLHLEQKGINEHWKVETIVFQDSETLHQINCDEK